MKHYYGSGDVQRLLSLGSLRTAQLRIQAMNEELMSKGFWIERGKVPVKFFHEKYPYLQEGQSLQKGGKHHAEQYSHRDLERA